MEQPGRSTRVSAAPLAPVNLAFVVGQCSSAPTVRVTGSGRRVADLSVRTCRDGEGATSVPVTLWDPPAWVDDLAEGDPVVAFGCFRRRFYRGAQGGAIARSQLEARTLAKAGDRRRVAAVLRRVREAISGLE